MGESGDLGATVEGLAHQPKFHTTWVIDKAAVEGKLKIYNRAHRGPLCSW